MEHVAYLFLNTKNKKNNREFLQTVENELEWLFRPYVQGLSSAVQINKKKLTRG